MGINVKVLSLALPEDRFNLLSLQSLSMTTLFYGLVLGNHPTFINDINTIRKKLNIKKLNHPAGVASDEQFSIPYSEGLDKHKKLFDEVNALLGKYQLWSNWQLPIEVMVFTGVLPIPQDNSQFVFHPVVNRREVELRETKRLTDLYDFPQSEMAQYISRLGFPAIHITERMNKPNQLINWIKTNWDTIISPELQKLPARKKQRADIERLAIGLWLKEQRNSNTWDEIEKKIDNFEISDPDFFGTEKTRITPNKVSGPDLIYSANETLAQFFPL